MTAIVALAAAAPILIAHRGASGERPEHTLEAYQLAIEQGADYIEPDLVITRDGVLIARHENEIGGTTDVASRPEFAARRRTQRIDGVEFSGWFVEDFTAAEIATLRARERLAPLRPASATHDGRYGVPTLDEILQLVATHNATAGARPVGVYIETKHPSHFAALGLDFERPLLDALGRRGFLAPGAPVFIQSFEAEILERLRRRDTRLPLILLVEGGERTAPLLTDAGLESVATYAQGIGVAKSLVIPRVAGNRLGQPTALVARAHARGLLVHAWTFRAENEFLPAELRSSKSPAALGRMDHEIAAFLAAGVDGIFTDQPALSGMRPVSAIPRPAN